MANIDETEAEVYTALVLGANVYARELEECGTQQLDGNTRRRCDLTFIRKIEMNRYNIDIDHWNFKN
jgi:hypothetical protein